jgi:hypothetical protein
MQYAKILIKMNDINGDPDIIIKGNSGKKWLQHLQTMMADQ